MKVLGLRCSQGHAFEGWFASGEAFDAQMAGGLVECPLCGSHEITKLPSAPRLNLGAGRERAPSVPAPASAPAGMPVEGRWLHAVREAVAQAEDVGERFPEEARRIHHGEAAERGIRGQASREQVRALLDEGIAVLPVPPALKETLQ